MAKREICLAGGCFWGTQAYLDLLPGILETTVGYANACIDSPSYEQVCTGATNAAEAVLVTYDPATISLELLLEAYLRTIDPTAVNRQGNDIGTQYRTGIYWLDAKDESTIRNFIAREQGRFGRPFAIELAPLESFAPAEEYHQDYLAKNPMGYCHVNLADARTFIDERIRS